MKLDVPSYNLAELTAGEAAATSGGWGSRIVCSSYCEDVRSCSCMGDNALIVWSGK